jgi:hypothetical protein
MGCAEVRRAQDPLDVPISSLPVEKVHLRVLGVRQVSGAGGAHDSRYLQLFAPSYPAASRAEVMVQILRMSG